MKFAAVLAPIALAGAVMAPAASASTPASTHPVAQGASAASHVGVGEPGRLFTIRNDSSQNIVLSATGGDSPWADPPPAIGTVVKPGGAIGFEVAHRGYTTDGWATFTNQTGLPGPFTVHMREQALGYGESTCDSTPHRLLACYSDHGEGAQEDLIRAWDRVPTQTNIGSDQPSAQAELIHRLCDVQTEATCKFTPTKEEKTFGVEHMVSDSHIIRNRSSDPMHTNLEWKDTVETTDGFDIGGNVSANLFDVVKIGVDGQYHHEVTRSNEFKQTLELTVNPGDKGWVTDQAPVFRETGTMTVTMYNSTWNLTNVSFDMPDPSGNGIFTGYTARDNT
jgi:hypothetical protein